MQFSILSLIVLLSAQVATCGNLRVKKAPAKPFVLQMQRQSLTGLSTNGADLGVYMTDLRVGTSKPGDKEQHFRVIFDLSSGSVVLPSKRCRDVTCYKHRRYDKRQSTTSVDIMGDGTPVHPKIRLVDDSEETDQHRDSVELGFDTVDMGTGFLKGSFLQDEVCIGDDGDTKCATMNIVAATSMDDLPFRVMPYDGVVGLGLEGTSLTAATRWNFFRALMVGNQNPVMQVGLFLDGVNGGEISFGGYNSERVHSEISWAPIAELEEGFWQVEIKAVVLGNRTLDICTGPRNKHCRGIVDMGAAHLSVPNAAANQMEDMLKMLGPVGLTEANMNSADVKLNLVIAGTSISLSPMDFLGNPDCLKAEHKCRPAISRNGMDGKVSDKDAGGMFVLGESVLRHYYTVFDYDAKRIGFSPTKGRKGLLGKPGAAKTCPIKGGPRSCLEDKELEDPEEDGSIDAKGGMIFLVQVKITKSKTRVKI